MEEKGVSSSFIVISDENSNSDSLYPMFIGVSCAFFALRLLPEPEIHDEKWSEVRSRMLKGTALLGLLVWTVQRSVVTAEKAKLLQKLEKAHSEIDELKKRRSEDAKANEKVVSIFSAREQSWFHERRKLTNDLRVVEARKERSVSELVDKMKEIEVILQLKDKMIEEAERRRLESDEKLKAAEHLAEEMRESLRSENERHSSEISKHKTAFMELVSNQRQLEAEMGRALRQVEAAKEELDTMLEEKEKVVLANQRLSVEIVRVHKDMERISRLDAAEKQMLLKEVRSSKVKRKEAEVEAARWKAVYESKHDRISLRNLFLKHVNGKSQRADAATTLDAWNHKRKGVELLSFVADGNQEFMSTEKVEEKHSVEIYGLLEQVRQRDERIEAYSWRLMSTELESRRLQSHIEALDRDIAQFRQDNAKLEGMLLDREAKLRSLQEQLMQFVAPKPKPQRLSFNSPALDDDTVWSSVKVVRREAGETKAVPEEISQQVENDIVFTLEKPSNNVIKEGGLDHTRHERVEAEEVAGQWKMDVHALGVSFKVKRLKQQLFVLERLIEKEGTSENGECSERVKGFYELMSFLNKQADRYHSLQGKIDQLSKRMQEKKVNSKCGKTREDDEMRRMEHFLEETFQLQRYIVATGQKSMQVESKIASNLVAEAAEDIEKHGGFDIERFGDSLKALFRETQRGLEVRISRIIGDLEGTLARDGFDTWRRL